MGAVHRLAYLLIGVGAILVVIVADMPRAARVTLGIVGLMALGSSLSGYCVTCHTLGLTTRDNRVRRTP
jgi:hypothetical protein